jgi:hypothetical protein
MEGEDSYARDIDLRRRFPKYSPLDTAMSLLGGMLNFDFIRLLYERCALGSIPSSNAEMK